MNCDRCIEKYQGPAATPREEYWDEARAKGWLVESQGVFCPACSSLEAVKRVMARLRKPSDSIRRVKIDGYDI